MSKKDPYEHSKKIRDRILEIMQQVIKTDPVIKTKRAFAESIHTTPAAINRWENDEGYPTIENVADICILYGESFDQVVTGKVNSSGNLKKKLDEVKVLLKGIERALWKILLTNLPQYE